MDEFSVSIASVGEALRGLLVASSYSIKPSKQHLIQTLGVFLVS